MAEYSHPHFFIKKKPQVLPCLYQRRRGSNFKVPSQKQTKTWKTFNRKA